MASKEVKSGPQNLRSACPIACALDVVGDRWTLLIVRDIFKKKTKYNDFLNGDEKFPSNVLAQRLKRLEEVGIVARSKYSERPPRYEYQLTQKGLELGKVLEALYHWGNKNILQKTQ